jgi:hypothetical protein
VPPRRGRTLLVVGAVLGVLVLLGGIGVGVKMLGGKDTTSTRGPDAAASPSAGAAASTPATTEPTAAPPQTASAPPVASTPPPPATLGKGEAELTVRCVPVACEKVAVDGKVYNDPPPSFVLPEGKHGIGVSKKGYAGGWKLVPLAAGQRQSVDFKLVEMPATTQKPASKPYVPRRAPR